MLGAGHGCSSGSLVLLGVFPACISPSHHFTPHAQSACTCPPPMPSQLLHCINTRAWCECFSGTICSACSATAPKPPNLSKTKASHRTQDFLRRPRCTINTELWMQVKEEQHKSDINEQSLAFPPQQALQSWHPADPKPCYPQMTPQLHLLYKVP